jgi:hypothetical protein
VILTAKSCSFSVFYYKRRLTRFYYALITCASMIVASVVLGSISNDLEILYVPLVTAVVSLVLSVEGAAPQTIIIDPVHSSYSVNRGKSLAESNHCHNIYIRILTRPGSGTFWAVLNGVNLESPVKLSHETANKKKLRTLCKKLASRLSINYFDIHNHSKHHVIRHRKPEPPPLPLMIPLESCPTNVESRMDTK